jgi:hypothetical protein
MDDSSRQRFVWGWLRFFLGWLQMSLVAASIGALVTVGLRLITFALVGAATAVAITSRLLYSGRVGPELKGNYPDGK